MTSKDIAAEIKRGMSLAFFCCAYADMAEEAGEPLSGEIMEHLPEETDPAAIHAADTLAIQLCDGYNFAEPGLNLTQKLASLYVGACKLPKDGADRELSPELFGHYLAMEAMGTGVGMESFGHAVSELFSTIPYVEFGSHSLQKDYFQTSEDE